MEGNYFLRKIEDGDLYDVFRLSNEDYVRKFSINPNKISWETHVKWFEHILKSDQDVFYVVADRENHFLGQLRYKIENHSAIVSISLNKSLTGRGLSKQLLEKSIQMLAKEREEIESIVAFISDNNIASKKLFEQAGFVCIGKDTDMLKFIYWMKKGV